MRKAFYWARPGGTAGRRLPGAWWLWLLLVPALGRGSDLFVAPLGSPTGTGTMDQPYDLATALSGAVGQPGDTFWLLGGIYALGHVDTKIQGAPGQPFTFRPVAGQEARVAGSISFYNSLGNVILRDFELFSADTNRLSAQTGAGFSPTDINIIPGIASYAPNLSFINLVVHDQTRHGFYLSQVSSNNLVYGCLVYNNGWASPDNAEGHGLYVQGALGAKLLADNLVFNNAGANMHIYENGSGLHLEGITMDGNVAFNAGAIQKVRPYRDWLVGVDAPARNADRIVLENNMSYHPPQSSAYSQIQIGRDGINGSVALLKNYMPQGLVMNNWTIAAVADNLFVSQVTNPAVSLNQTLVALAAAWNANTYALAAATNGFTGNAIELGFADWQVATGYDLNSTTGVTNLTGAKVFVRPNKYAPGRANLIVYNWDNLASVAVDVSAVLTNGAAYEVRNAEDYFAPPVLSGVYDGTPLTLPTTGLTVAAPTAPLATAPATGPTFNVFVLLPRSARLQASLNSGQVQLSWPANAGNWVLQSTDAFATNSVWVDEAAAPVATGGLYQFTAPLAYSNRFYRLRAQ